VVVPGSDDAWAHTKTARYIPVSRLEIAVKFSSAGTIP